MGTLEGKVAFITGAARGQGRSHAVRLAEEGADILAVDICHDISTAHYPMATQDDLDETASMVKDLGRRVIALQADVRDRSALKAVVGDGLAQLGRLDIVLANAGVMFWDPPDASPSDDEDDRAWSDAVGIMLTGVRNTIKVTQQALIDSGGGSIVITSSTAGIKGMTDGSGGGDGYTAAKHGVVGLMRAYANLLAPYNIRVNTVHPTGCATTMVMNEAFGAFVEANPQLASTMQNLLPVEMIEPLDVSNAIAWLVSDAARYVTGVMLPVDAGFTTRN